MGILEKYSSNLKQLNERVTQDDIALEIEDLKDDIKYIELTYGVTLVGERLNLTKPYSDCQGMTRAQCACFFSVWRNRMYARYLNKHNYDAALASGELLSVCAHDAKR